MSAARPDTWMPMYWGDYAKDTGHLSATQHGAYLMLIKHYWCNGKPLPDDDSQLWRIATCDGIAQWRKIKPVIAALFQVKGGIWRHRRVDDELIKAQRFLDRQAENGRKGGRPKNPDQKPDGTQNKPKNNPPLNPLGNPNHNPDETTSPSPSPSPSNHNPPPSPVPGELGPDWARCGAAVKAIMEARWPNDASVAMASTGVCRQWLADGFDVEKDILVTVEKLCASKTGSPISTLDYFTKAIAQRHADRAAGLPAPQSRIITERGSGPPPADPWDIRIKNHRDQLDAKRAIRDTTWHDFRLKWGPMPGEPGCMAPPELIAKYGPWPRKEAA